MQQRSGAPPLSRPFSRPSSPTRNSAPFPDIPEAKPGPNAFAQQAERMERHRLEGNAFYQQEVHRRRVTPPTSVHPALRQRSISEASSLPSLAVPGDMPTRESTMTTLSPFINAGKENISPENISSPLKLVPSPHVMENAEPTFRGMIEEREERRLYSGLEGQEERIPVYQTFKPTPKPASNEFVHPNERASVIPNTPRRTPRKPRVSLPTQDSRASLDTHGSKSPKKSFFERLRFSKSTAPASPSMNSLQPAAGVEETKMPVKAKAVFGSPSKTMLAGTATSGHTASDNTTPVAKQGLARSPSKQKKGFFSSRRGTEVTGDTSTTITNRQSGSTEETGRPKTASSTTATSLGRRTPQTAVSEPSQNAYMNGRRMPSQTFSDRGPRHDAAVKACAVARSQSLKYMDSSQPPPTPPSKDTPPHEKAEKERLRGLGIMGNGTPAFHAARSAGSGRMDGLVSTSDLLSPTRFGGYGQKVQPTLVTQPSMYSLHASVVPEMLESSAFEEMKARIDGLGLEGFNNPADPETCYQPASESIYSPSVYNDEWDARKSVVIKTPKASHRRTMDDLPTLPEMPERNSGPSHRTAKSSASGITIPIFYPELGKDPSTSGKTPQISENTPQMVEIGRMRPSLDETPCHGFSHSRSESRNSALFTTPMPERGTPVMYTSPPFSHQSAMPSPLQPATQDQPEYLKPDVYTPPPKKPAATKDRARRDADGASEFERRLAMFEGQASANGAGTHKLAGSESASRNIMDNVPVLKASTSPERGTSPPGGNPYANQAAAFADPKKSGPADKQDQMLQLLSQLVARNEDMATMREEMRAAQARMDERLAAMEQTNRSSPSPTLSYKLLDSNSIVSGSRSVRSQGSANGSQTSLPLPNLPQTEQPSNNFRNSQARIATTFAHEFYRRSQILSPPSTVDDSDSLSSPLPGSAFDGMQESEVETQAINHGGSETSGERMEDLRRKNKELTDLVQGFAKELENMRRQMGRGV